MTPAEQSRPSAFGLLSMRLRAQEEGGSLGIHSLVGVGTTVTVTFPLARTSDD
jgi:signal transduction histidine kinase